MPEVLSLNEAMLNEAAMTRNSRPMLSTATHLSTVALEKFYRMGR